MRKKILDEEADRMTKKTNGGGRLWLRKSEMEVSEEEEGWSSVWRRKNGERTASRARKMEEAWVVVLKETEELGEVIDPPLTEKRSGGSASSDRDAILARVETEKKMSLIKAWEDSEKVKAENKAIKKMADILAWENSKKAAVEAELRKMEEALEKKKAEYAEKMMNRIATLHKEAEEKRAIGEARRNEDILNIEEMAAKYRATGQCPKKQLGCF